MANPTRLPSGLSIANRGSNILVEAPIKQLIVPLSFDDGVAENITSFVLPATAVLLPSVLLNVRVAEVTGVTKTLSAGTDSTSGGDADGYAVGLDVSAIGLKKATLLDGAVTLGALLFVESGAGVDVANAPEIDVSSGGKAISWTPGSADWAEFKGDLILEYRDIRPL
jgi:hypothetical protein